MAIDEEFPSQLRPWDDDVEKRLLERYPGIAPEQARHIYEYARSHHRFAGMENQPVAEHLTRMLPGAGPFHEHRLAEEYAGALHRIQAGEPSQSQPNPIGIGRWSEFRDQASDYDLVAYYRRLHDIEKSRTEWEQFGAGAERIPAMIGEAIAGGNALRLGGAGALAGEAGVAGLGSGMAAPTIAQVGRAALAGAPAWAARTAATTATMPSMWAPDWIHRNMEEGRDPTDPRGLPPALAMSFLNVAVLGTLKPVGDAIGGTGLKAMAGRFLTRTGVGLIEQAAIDVVGSAAKLETGYGTLGALWRGDLKGAGKQALHQALMFGAFAAMHEYQSPHEAAKGLQDSMKDAKAAGLPVEQAAQKAAQEAQARVGLFDRGEQVPTDPFERFQHEVVRGVPHEEAQARIDSGAPPGPQPQADPTQQPGFMRNAPPQGTPTEPVGARPPEQASIAGQASPEALARPNMGVPVVPGGVAERSAASAPEPTMSPQAEQAIRNLAVGLEMGRNIHGKMVKISSKEAMTASIDQVEQIVRQKFGNQVVDALIGGVEKPEQVQQPAHPEVAPNQAQEVQAQPETAGGPAPATPMPAVENRPLTPEARQAEVDRLSAEQAVDMGRQASGATEPRRRTFGETVLPDEVARPIEDSPVLSQFEKNSLSALLSGVSTRQAEALIGPSHPKGSATYETIRKHAAKAFKKLKETDTTFMPGFDTLGDFFLEQQITAAGRLLGQGQNVSAADLGNVGEHSRQAVGSKESLVDQIAKLEEERNLYREELARDNNEARRLADQLSIGKPEREVHRDVDAALAESIAVATRQRNIGAVEVAPREVGAGPGAQATVGERAQTEGPGRESQTPAVKELTDAAAKEELKASNLNAAARRGLGMKDRAGELDIKAAAQAVKEKVQGTYDMLRKIGGAIAPRMLRLSERAANALAEYISVPSFVERGKDYFIDRLRGPNVSDATANAWAAAHQEIRFRYAEKELKRMAYETWLAAQTEKDPAKKRALIAESAAYTNKEWGMGTFIGPDKPFKTQAEFDAVANSTEFKDYRERYRTEFVPKIEELFRMAEGIDPSDPIDRLTQMPGEPISAFALKEDPKTSDTAVSAGAGKAGNLGNVKQRKLGAAREFGGTAEFYETDFNKVIERTLGSRAGKAKQANMNRVMVEDGVAQWGRSGQKIDGFTEFDGVRPPKGTQEAAAQGEQSLYVKNDGGVNVNTGAAFEYRQALQVDAPFQSVRAVTQPITGVSLMAIVEATQHIKNIGTSVFEPGMWWNPLARMKKVIDVYKQTPEVLKQAMDLAEIGAIKNKGMETGKIGFLGKFDPTTWGGKLIDFVDTVQRLNLADAFDAMAKNGTVKGGDAAKRDFINGVLGQYNRRAQNQIIAWLRDTGIGPFATASSTFNVQGVRALTGSSPLQATSVGNAVRLRAEKLLQMGAVMTLAPIINYAVWKNIFGDDNTPIGAIKTGVDPATGKTSYFDVAALTGFTRGARVTGLLAIAEGNRPGAQAYGANHASIGDRAFRDIWQGALHTAEGPAVNVATTLATGENTFGMPVAKRADHASGQWQLAANLQGLMWNMNPLISSVTGASRPERHETNTGLLGAIGYPNSEIPPAQRAVGALGIGTKVSAGPPGRPLIGARH